MADSKLLVCSLLLLVVCIYSFVSDALVWSGVGFFLYLATGGLGAVTAIKSNEDVNKIYGYVNLGSQIAGVDFIMIDVCILCGVDKKMAYINLVPPAIDIIMKFVVDSNWELVTPLTHIVSMGLMCFFGYRDQKYVLFLAAIGFLLAISRLWKNSEIDNVAITHVFSTIGVFFVGWFLDGKDLKELGVDV